MPPYRKKNAGKTKSARTSTSGSDLRLFDFSQTKPLAPDNDAPEVVDIPVSKKRRGRPPTCLRMRMQNRDTNKYTATSKPSTSPQNTRPTRTNSPITSSATFERKPTENELFLKAELMPTHEKRKKRKCVRHKSSYNSLKPNLKPLDRRLKCNRQLGSKRTRIASGPDLTHTERYGGELVLASTHGEISPHIAETEIPVNESVSVSITQPELNAKLSSYSASKTCSFERNESLNKNIATVHVETSDIVTSVDTCSTSVQIPAQAPVKSREILSRRTQNKRYTKKAKCSSVKKFSDVADKPLFSQVASSSAASASSSVTNSGPILEPYPALKPIASESPSISLITPISSGPLAPNMKIPPKAKLWQASKRKSTTDIKRKHDVSDSSLQISPTYSDIVKRRCPGLVARTQPAKSKVAGVTGSTYRQHCRNSDAILDTFDVAFPIAAVSRPTPLERRHLRDQRILNASLAESRKTAIDNSSEDMLNLRNTTIDKLEGVAQGRKRF